MNCLFKISISLAVSVSAQPDLELDEQLYNVIIYLWTTIYIRVSRK